MSIVEVVRKTTTVVEVGHPGVQGPPGTGGGGGAVNSVNGKTGAVVLTSTDVGLGNVDNTSDANKPVSTAQAAADAAVLASANATTAAHAGRTDNPHATTAAQVGADPTGTAAAAVSAHTAAANPHPQYPLASSLATVATSGAYADLSGRPSLGTAAPLNVPATGDAASGEVVKGNDSRLTNARTPTAHTHPSTDINDSTAAGRALLTATDAAAQRTALGVPAGSGNSTGTNTGDETGARIATLLHAASNKTTLVDADEVNGTDSAASFGLIRTTWGNVKAFLKTYFDTLYLALAGGKLTGALNWANTATIASAATTDIGAATSNVVIISGTTPITGLGTIAAGAERVVQFSGALTLTHNATSLILPGGASITTAAGDVAYFVSLGAGNWRCTGYQKANGQAVVSSGGTPAGSGTELQYRNAGAFGAMSGTAWTDASRALTIDGGTRTTSGSTVSITETRNAAGVTFPGALIVNTTETASAAGSLVADFQTGGTSRMSVRKDGRVTASQYSMADVYIGQRTTSNSLFNVYTSGGTAMMEVQGGGGGLIINNAQCPVFGIGNGTTNAAEVGFARDANRVGKITDGGTTNLGDLKLRNLIATGNIARGIVAKTASYTVTANDGVIECDATSAAITLTLPAVASATPGATYTLKKTDSSGNAVIWDGNASETIDGATTVQTTTQWASITVMPNAARTAWLTIKD